MLDERWIKALHVEALREEELHAGREPHVLFQASTIGALLDGAYDGDLSFAELAEHGDLGPRHAERPRRRDDRARGRASTAPTSRARSTPSRPRQKTPFAVVTRFEPAIEEEIDGPLSHQELLARLDALVPGGSALAARCDSTAASSSSAPARCRARARPTGR